MIFTGLLAAVGITQIGFLISADRTATEAAIAAKDSADAAKKSADVFANVERPYFFIDAKPEPIVSKDAPDKPTPKIAYSITNMGRVPAVVRLLLTNCNLIESLPPTQIVDANKFRPGIIAIGAAGRLDIRERCEFAKPFTPQEWSDIQSAKKIMVFEAIFIYEGALDFTYVTSLAYRIDVFTGDAFPIGGSAYNYDDSVSGRLSKVDKMIFPKLRFSQSPQKAP